jgi:NADPH:quinone reductase-like Zn-dependent oxidoreductase
MKAIIFEKHGGPEVLEPREVSEPAIGPDDARSEARQRFGRVVLVP